MLQVSSFVSLFVILIFFRRGWGGRLLVLIMLYPGAHNLSMKALKVSETRFSCLPQRDKLLTE